MLKAQPVGKGEVSFSHQYQLLAEASDQVVGCQVINPQLGYRLLRPDLVAVFGKYELLICCSSGRLEDISNYRVQNEEKTFVEIIPIRLTGVEKIEPELLGRVQCQINPVRMLDCTARVVNVAHNRSEKYEKLSKHSSSNTWKIEVEVTGALHAELILNLEQLTEVTPCTERSEIDATTNKNLPLDNYKQSFGKYLRPGTDIVYIGPTSGVDGYMTLVMNPPPPKPSIEGG
ncbi:MAG: hypothetical protein HPY81_03020 [Firmicutes bacterium]|nr:hypothetical protein [Bacillota bacterium]